MCDQCIEWGGKRWHRYGDGYYERTDKSVRPKRTRRLHREKWLAEVGDIPDGHHVHHVNHDKGDNRIENLVCITAGDHTREHGILANAPKRDWSTVEPVSVACVDCGAVVQRKRTLPTVRCKTCQYRQAERRRSFPRNCQHCSTEFVSRAGNFCGQRCVNLATNGATVRVLPAG